MLHLQDGDPHGVCAVSVVAFSRIERSVPSCTHFAHIVCVWNHPGSLVLAPHLTVRAFRRLHG